MEYKDREQIRKNYKDHLPDIIKAKGRYDASYILGDFYRTNFLSPIEKNVWDSIRYLGLRFFPQFPILNYFADFADPINKIVIEVDGKEWHKDQEKDLKRQKEIEADGWRVYRLPGSMTFKESEDFFQDDWQAQCNSDEIEERYRDRLDQYRWGSAEGFLTQFKKLYR